MEELTTSETLVMKVIWQNDEPMSIQDILQRVNSAYGKDWKTQTVSTFLSKMVKKGYLSMQRRGRYFFYELLVTEEAYSRREIAKCVEFWGNGKIDHLLTAFSEVHELTEEERANIRELLDELE